MRHRALIRITLAFALIAPSSAHASESEQASRLAELRAEVERLAADVEAEKEDRRGELRSLELQRTDLEARVRQEEVRTQELERLIERQREMLQADDVAGEVLTPVLLDALAKLRGSVESGLPYRVPERLAEIDKLENQLRGGTLAPQRATTRIWQLIEDELRLTRENIMDRQVVVLDGDEVLVDVGRVGMVMMFFRTEDDRVGRVSGQPGAWSYDVYTTSAEIAGVTTLFDALDKQVRVGFFELPNALTEGT